MKRRDLFAGLVAAALLSLAGCQSLPEHANRWQGRFSLTMSSLGKVSSETGRFELIDAPGNRRRLDLLTPLSGVIARIEDTPEGAALWFGSSDVPKKAASLDELLQQNLGFTVPLDLLLQMLSDTQGRFTTGESDGWHYEITSRQPSGTPLRLLLRHPRTAALPDIKLILAISP